MKRMDVMTVLGIVIGVGLVIGSILLQGSVLVFWSPSALMITVGGSFGALLINFGLGQIKQVVQVTRQAFVEVRRNPREIIDFFYNLSQKSRREGLLALEDDVHELDDPFLKKGLQMIIDGMDPEIMKEILNIEVDSLQERHRVGQDVFRSWASLAPAFGMIGTLIGLINMLIRLDDPSAIGPGMAIALLTTFYGVLFANLILTPIAGKLSLRSDEEMLIKEAMIEGMICIQGGVNPRVLQDKLKAFMRPSEREDERAAPEEDSREGMAADHV